MGELGTIGGVRYLRGARYLGGARSLRGGTYLRGARYLGGGRYPAPPVSREHRVLRTLGVRTVLIWYLINYVPFVYGSAVLPGW